MCARRIRERIHGGRDPEHPLPPLSSPAAVGLACGLRLDGGLTIQLQEKFGVRQTHYARNHPETRLPG